MKITIFVKNITIQTIVYYVNKKLILMKKNFRKTGHGF